MDTYINTYIYIYYNYISSYSTIEFTKFLKSKNSLSLALFGASPAAPRHSAGFFLQGYP